MKDALAALLAAILSPIRRIQRHRDARATHKLPAWMTAESPCCGSPMRQNASGELRCTSCHKTYPPEDAT